MSGTEVGSERYASAIVLRVDSTFARLPLMSYSLAVEGDVRDATGESIERLAFTIEQRCGNDTACLRSVVSGEEDLVMADTLPRLLPETPVFEKMAEPVDEIYQIWAVPVDSVRNAVRFEIRTRPSERRRTSILSAVSIVDTLTGVEMYSEQTTAHRSFVTTETKTLRTRLASDSDLSNAFPAFVSYESQLTMPFRKRTYEMLGRFSRPEAPASQTAGD